MTIETIKLWEDREDVELTTFVSIPEPFIENPIPKPAVIVCPGGGYQTCSRHGSAGDPVAMAFAADGFQAFVLEYSVESRAPEKKTCFPAQLMDLGKAILCIRAHAEAWYIDVDKISVVGFSAGAHLCAMLATTWHEPLLAESFAVDPHVFKPLSAICLYGLYDYTYQNDYNNSHADPAHPGDMNTHVFGCAHPTREAEKRYSPCEHISQKTPPMFLAAAIDDSMVPSIQSVRMAEKLHEAGIPYELHMFQYGDHAFALGQNLYEPYRRDKRRSCAEWFPLAENFLMHQISPETVEIERLPFWNPSGRLPGHPIA